MLPSRLSPKAYTGDVSALHIVRSPLVKSDYIIVAGIGSQVHIYSLNSTSHLCTQTVLPQGSRVHGIATTLQNDVLLMAVHGDRHVQCWAIDGNLHLHHHCSISKLTAWTMALHLSHSGVLVVGLCNNTVEFYQLSPGHAEKTSSYRSEEKCLLYSMAIYKVPTSRVYRIASGTILGNGVVWSLEYSGAALAMGGEDIAVQYRLIGHEGSIYKIQWRDDGNQVATASDDRTLRIWNIPRSTASQAEDLTSEQVLWGHTGRVWDCTYLQQHIVTVSEDCSFKIWTHGGKCIAHIDAHRGRGIWQCAGIAHKSVLVTGGADGGVKLWNLEPWIDSDNQNNNHTLTNICIDISSVLFQGGKKCKDFVRCLKLTPSRIVYMATNHGKLWKNSVSVNGLDKAWELVYHTKDRSPIIRLCTYLDSRAIIATRDGSVICFCEGQKTHDFVPSTAVVSLFCFNLHAQEHVFILALNQQLMLWKLGENSEPQELIATGLHGYKYGSISEVVATESGYIVTGDTVGHVAIYRIQSSVLQLVASYALIPSSTPAVRKISVLAECPDLTLTVLAAEGLVTKLKLLDGKEVYAVNQETFHCPNIIDWYLVRSTGSKIVGGYVESDFVVYDSQTETEIVKRIPCGGWRRASASLLTLKDFFLIHYKGNELHLHYRSFSDNTPCALHAPHHGREVHVGIILPRTPPVIITAGEDGFIRQLAEGTTRSVIVAEHPSYASIRCLGCAPVPNKDNVFHLFSAGTRDIAAAWELHISPSGTVQECIPRAKKLPSYFSGRGEKPSVEDMEQRIMSLTCVSTGEDGGSLLVIIGGSDGMIQVLSMSHSSATWVFKYELQHHSGPVMSLAHNGRTLASGGTDGSIALWNLRDIREGSSNATKPVCELQHVHQSGVNAIAMAGDVLVSGGDDQSLCVILLEGCTVKSMCSHACAHASAVRGVWTDGIDLVLSVGLDQRLRRWRLLQTALLQENESVITQTIEPAGLDVQGKSILVVGRGVQLFKLSDE